MILNAQAQCIKHFILLEFISMMKTKLILILITCLFSYAVHTAEVFRWVDGNGKVHFSDKPQDKNATSISVKPQPKIDKNHVNNTNPPASSASQERLLDAYGERRRQKQEQQAKEQQAKLEAERQQQECDRLRNYLSRTEGNRIFNTDENGDRVFLSDAAIDSSRAQHQANIDKHCR